MPTRYPPDYLYHILNMYDFDYIVTEMDNGERTLVVYVNDGEPEFEPEDKE